MGSRPALAVAALLAGCQFEGGLGDGLLCPTGECPAGQVCREGVCSADGSSADAGLPTDGSNRQEDAGVIIDGGLGLNLVVNPGMEDGIDPWTAFNSLLTTSEVEHSEEASLQVCADSPGDFTVYEDVVKSPPNEVVAGTNYSASVWVRAPSSAAPESMKLTIRETGGSLDRGDHDGPTVTGPGDTWVKLEASGTIQEADRDNVILIVWGLESSGSACFLVDDAVMREE